MDEREVLREFLRVTRHEVMEPPPARRGAPQPPAAVRLGEVAGREALPEPATAAPAARDLAALVAARRSRRRYTGGSLTRAELSFLLWCTQGLAEAAGAAGNLRTVPSAGARHAFETLLLIRRVEGLAPGLVQYDPSAHALLRLPAAPGLDAALTAACYGQGCVAEAAALFVWVAVAERMTWRYGARGLRYLHLDAGHLCQNLYLGVEALGLGTVAVAAFDDAAVNNCLGLDGEARFAIYMAPVGRRA